MSDSTQQFFPPATTIEIDCATSAKGDINISWRIKLQEPTAESPADQDEADARQVARAAWLVMQATELAARGKVIYSRKLISEEAIQQEADRLAAESDQVAEDDTAAEDDGYTPLLVGGVKVSESRHVDLADTSFANGDRVIPEEPATLTDINSDF